ncbi:MAG: hypothetical protein P8Y28_06675, partial [Gammaproteobacteria bacterium]
MKIFQIQQYYNSKVQKFYAALLVGLLPLGVFAEETTNSSEVPQFGGPSSVGGSLNEDARVKEPAFRFESIDNFLQPYFNHKARVNKEHGFAYGFDYTAMYQGASDSPGEDNAF